MEKEPIKVFGKIVGHHYTISPQEYGVLHRDPVLRQTVTVRELALLAQDDGTIEFNEWLGFIYGHTVCLLEERLSHYR